MVGPTALPTEAGLGVRGSDARVSVVLGCLGAALAGLLAGLNALGLSIDPTHERLSDVMELVALAAGIALVVCLGFRRNPRVQLSVQLALSLSLVAAAYAVTRERGDVDLLLGWFLMCALAPLVLCVGAAAAAAYDLIRARRSDAWRLAVAPVVIAVAVSTIPLGISVGGDPGDEPEAAVRRQLGADTLVTCSRSVWNRDAFSCSIATETTSGTCEVWLGPPGEIVRSGRVGGPGGCVQSFRE